MSWRERSTTAIRSLSSQRQTPTTLSGSLVAWRVGSYRALAASKGFVRLKRPNSTIEGVAGAIVVCGVSSITLELDGRSLAVAVSMAPTERWRDEVRKRDVVTVLFIRPRRLRSSSIRSLIRAGRVFAGVATAVSVDGVSLARRYQFVGGQSVESPIPQAHSVLLDVSVLVDLERAAAKRGDPNLWPAAQQLALQLVSMDVFPGPGLLELLYDRGANSLNWDRIQSVLAAVNAWFDGGVARASSLEAVRAAYVCQLGKNLIDSDLRHEEHFVQQVYYASLLKLACLWTEPEWVQGPSACGSVRGVRALDGARTPHCEPLAAAGRPRSAGRSAGSCCDIHRTAHRELARGGRSRGYGALRGTSSTSMRSACSRPVLLPTSKDVR